MPTEDRFYADVGGIFLAHEFVLNRSNKCEYPNGRGRYGLIYVIEGRAEIRFVGAAPLTVTEGDVLLLPPSAAYRITTETDFHHYTVNFELRRETSSLCALDSSFCLLNKEKTRGIERELRELVGLWTAKHSGYRMRATACLYRLLSDFHDAYEDEDEDGARGRLAPAKERIEKDFSEAVALERLAKLCSMSVSNFRREWKKIYGDSPLRYRDRIRLRSAKEYLSSGYYSVTEIAEKCGFEDVSYFVRFFRKHEGMTPGEWKKQMVEY